MTWKLAWDGRSEAVNTTLAYYPELLAFPVVGCPVGTAPAADAVDAS